VHAVLFHALDNPQSRHRNLVRFGTQLQSVGKTHDVQTRVCKYKSKENKYAERNILKPMVNSKILIDKHGKFRNKLANSKANLYGYKNKIY